jgi:integrase
MRENKPYKRIRCPKRCWESTTHDIRKAPPKCPKCSTRTEYSADWYIRVNGKRRNIGPNKDQVAVSVNVATIIDAMQKGQTGEGPKSWTVAVKRFLDGCECSAVTKTRYEDLLRLQLNPFFGHFEDITKIEFDDVKEFTKILGQVITKSGKPMTKTTMNRYLTLLKMICKYNGHRINDPRTGKSFKNYKEQRRVRELSADEETRLKAELARVPHWLLAALIALEAGLRKNSVLGLEWLREKGKKPPMYVDLGNRIIHTIGKRGKVYEVPISNTLFLILAAEKERQEEKYGYVKWVIPSPDNYDKRIPVYSHDGFDNAVERAGIEDFRFHDLRHTFATRFYRRTQDLRTLQVLLNHEQSTTTEIYTHVTMDDMRRQIEKGAPAPEVRVVQ